MKVPCKNIMLTLFLMVIGTACARPTGLDLVNAKLRGTINGRNLRFVLDVDAVNHDRDRRIRVLSGDVVLTEKPKLPKGWKLSYSVASHSYYLEMPEESRAKVSLAFAARARHGIRGWLESDFRALTRAVRHVELVSDRADMDIRLPGALRVTRTPDEKGGLTVTGLLGPDRKIQIAWKPKVAKMDAKLVVAARANTIISVGAGVLAQDTVYDFNGSSIVFALNSADLSLMGFTSSQSVATKKDRQFACIRTNRCDIDCHVRGHMQNQRRTISSTPSSNQLPRGRPSQTQDHRQSLQMQRRRDCRDPPGS